eukprot:6957147-Ditylum_brightwellii.AAC.1
MSSYLTSNDTVHNSIVYMLPTLVLPEKHLWICKNGLSGLFNIGRRLWAIAITEQNKTTAKKDHCGELSIKEGLPFATCIVCEETGMTLWDDNPDKVLLLPHISKWQCYARWYFQRRWIVEKKNTVILVMMPVDEYMLKPYNDEEFGIFLFPTGSEHKRKKGADTCTDCLVLTKKFRMNRIKSEDKNSDSEIGDDDLNESANDLEAEIENELARSDLETAIEAYTAIGPKH